MTSPRSFVTLLAGCLVGWCAVLTAAVASAAETTDPVPMTKTLIILKLDAGQPVPIRVKTQQEPPALTIEFPPGKVIAALPERSTIAKGAITTMSVQYQNASAAPSKRFLRSLQLTLSGSYPAHAWSEPGRIVIEITHPAAVSGTSFEVGLRGGTILGGFTRAEISDRFRAMQEALTRARPVPVTIEVSAAPISPSGPSPNSSGWRGLRQGGVVPAASGGVTFRAPQATTSSSRSGPAGPWRSATPWAVFGCSMLLAIGAATWWASRLNASASGRRQLAPSGSGIRLASGTVLIDQLVWRAFERQGYQLVLEKLLAQPIAGTLRLATKDGAKTAMLLVSQGPFLEKQTVEQFVRAMQAEQVEQGILVTAGAFTVPAQRWAKEHQVTLVGREELTELLSAGAVTEYVSKQLAELNARLEEAKAGIHQHVGEIDALRRQRNEASWFLGEERAKSASLEAQLASLQQQLITQETELRRWEESVVTLRKQWEENEWYLGESRARIRHLEEQLDGLQDAARRVELAERAREEAGWYLNEERTARQRLETTLADLQQGLEAASQREQWFGNELDRLREELTALRAHGERRGQMRVRIPDARVEITNGSEEPIYVGTPRDISDVGFGLESDQELPVKTRLRIRLTLPGLPEPIENTGRVVWQRAEGDPVRYQSGCRWIILPESARSHLAQLVHPETPSQPS